MKCDFDGSLVIWQEECCVLFYDDSSFVFIPARISVDELNIWCKQYDGCSVNVKQKITSVCILDLLEFLMLVFHDK